VIRWSPAPILAAALLLTACGSTPPTEVFSLTPTAPRPVTESAAGAPLIYVDLADVAEYADRTQMVTRSADYRVSLHEFAVWSETPGELITRSLVDDLALQFGDDRVLETPSPLYAYPDWRVELDVLRFDVDETGESVLDVRWTLLTGRDEDLATTRRELIVTQAADPTLAASRVTALRQGLGMLAQRIGAEIAGRR